MRLWREICLEESLLSVLQMQSFPLRKIIIRVIIAKHTLVAHS